MADYMLVQMTMGLDFMGYQEIENGNVIRITDMDGNTMVTISTNEIPYPDVPVGCYIIDSNPPKPSWGT